MHSRFSKKSREYFREYSRQQPFSKTCYVAPISVLVTNISALVEGEKGEVEKKNEEAKGGRESKKEGGGEQKNTKKQAKAEGAGRQKKEERKNGKGGKQDITEDF